MNKITKIAAIALAAGTMTASADVLLNVDLSVTDMVTITATNGNSSADASASNFTGWMLADFFSTAGAGVGVGAGTGDLVSVGSPSDGTPSLFNGSTSVGLNIWSFTTDSTGSMTAGSQAFSGSGSWSIDSVQYAAMLAGNTSGDIYFGADTDDDIGGAGVVLIGTWNVVPAPSALALLGLGGIAAGRRRR